MPATEKYRPSPGTPVVTTHPTRHRNPRCNETPQLADFFLISLLSRAFLLKLRFLRSFLFHLFLFSHKTIAPPLINPKISLSAFRKSNPASTHQTPPSASVLSTSRQRQNTKIKGKTTERREAKMAPTIRVTMFKIPDPENVKKFLENYRTLSATAVKVPQHFAPLPIQFPPSIPNPPLNLTHNPSLSLTYSPSPSLKIPTSISASTPPIPHNR